MVASKTEEELRKMTEAEEYALKIMSMMSESAEAPMLMQMREGALKMVAESPKKLETAEG